MKELTIRNYYENFINKSAYKDVDFQTYKEYLSKIIRKITDVVVEGKGYEFTNGFGIFIVEYEDCSNSSRKPGIDWAATKRKVKEISAQGLKPYNKQEAEEYAKAGLPYDGVDCLVYKDGSYKIRLKFICSKIEGTNNVGLVPTLTISKDLRGKTYKDLAASVSDSVLSARKLSPRIRAEIEIYRNKLNYLKYKHKMI
jgi:hypothetical protein